LSEFAADLNYRPAEELSELILNREREKLRAEREDCCKNHSK